MPVCTQPFDVVRRIFDVEVSADGGFVPHEAEIPIWNVMVV
jgi:hypothetical protein